MEKWRWDQGRLEYFRFDNIKAFARVLAPIDGTPLTGSRAQDPLRVPLEVGTGLRFSPNSYSVWRNYSRVFQSSFLCTNSNGNLAVTDLCRFLAANQNADVDEYMAHVIPRFSFAFPAFQDYKISNPPVFPFCAAVKYLLGAYKQSATETSISLPDIFSLLIGNNCTGEEAVAFYQNLPRTNRSPIGDEERQIREMFIFASQSSFLKWHRKRLYLDILPGDAESENAFTLLSQPIVRQRQADPASELLRLGSLGLVNLPNRSIAAALDTPRRQPADVLFTEGMRERVTHLRIERSPYLRRSYFAQQNKPYRCDVCGCDPVVVYPWLTDIDNILEVHHLLPLSSALLVTGSGTSFSDIVSLCPNCHRSIHSFYKKWLNKKKITDFVSKQQAQEVYESAKKEYQA